MVVLGTDFDRSVLPASAPAPAENGGTPATHRTHHGRRDALHRLSAEDGVDPDRLSDLVTL